MPYANKNVKKVKDKEYKEKNREALKEYYKQYHLKNREKRLEQMKRSYLKTKSIDNLRKSDKVPE